MMSKLHKLWIIMSTKACRWHYISEPKSSRSRGQFVLKYKGPVFSCDNDHSAEVPLPWQQTRAPLPDIRGQGRPAQHPPPGLRHLIQVTRLNISTNQYTDDAMQTRDICAGCLRVSHESHRWIHSVDVQKLQASTIAGCSRYRWLVTVTHNVTPCYRGGGPGDGGGSRHRPGGGAAAGQARRHRDLRGQEHREQQVRRTIL